MADAVLNAINTLVANMNSFYVVALLLGTAIIMILLMIFKDELWWRSLFMTMFGVIFTIAVSFAVANGILPVSVITLVWIGYAIMIIGTVIFVASIIVTALEGVVR